ncbi:hypothetical protein Tco_0542387 [Tanacetum coccineum]
MQNLLTRHVMLQVRTEKNIKNQNGKVSFKRGGTHRSSPKSGSCLLNLSCGTCHDLAGIAAYTDRFMSWLGSSTLGNSLDRRNELMRYVHGLASQIRGMVASNGAKDYAVKVRTTDELALCRKLQSIPFITPRPLA